MAVTCEILEEVGQVGKFSVNVIDWNKKGPKIDVREFYVNDAGESRPGKGISLKPTQIDALITLLQEAKEWFDDEDV